MLRAALCSWAHYNRGHLAEGCMKTASLALLLAFQTLSLSAARPQAGAKHIDIRTLSTRADRVSGGDVLVEIVAPGGTAKAVPHDITLNGRDVSPAFHT